MTAMPNVPDSWLEPVTSYNKQDDPCWAIAVMTRTPGDPLIKQKLMLAGRVSYLTEEEANANVKNLTKRRFQIYRLREGRYRLFDSTATLDEAIGVLTRNMNIGLHVIDSWHEKSNAIHKGIICTEWVAGMLQSIFGPPVEEYA